MTIINFYISSVNLWDNGQYVFSLQINPKEKIKSNVKGYSTKYNLIMDIHINKSYEGT